MKNNENSMFYSNLCDTLDLLNKIKTKAHLYKLDPINNQHGFNEEILERLEWVLNYSYEILYYLRVGEIDEQLEREDIKIDEWSKLVGNIKGIDSLFKYL